MSNSETPNPGPSDAGEAAFAVFLPAARALADLPAGLHARLAPNSPERFVSALGQMALRCRQMTVELQSAGKLHLSDRHIRHDLRAHLALVIGYAELWQKKAALERNPQGGISRYSQELERILAAAREALTKLDML